MNNIQAYLQKLDAEPNRALIDAYNQQFAKKNSKYELLVEDNIRPCFFSGNIEEPGKVITISLNPAYNPGKTEAAQEGKDFLAWYDYCLYRFDIYPSDKKIHAVFKNLLKVIAPPEKWDALDKRKFLQANMLNLDWCYYYSENFPSIKIDTLPLNLANQIRNSFDKTLLWMIKVAAPRMIFVHGKAIHEWVINNTHNLKTALVVNNSYGRDCRLFGGTLKNTSIPVYYLEHFINVVNRNASLKQINEYVNRRN